MAIRTDFISTSVAEDVLAIGILHLICKYPRRDFKAPGRCRRILGAHIHIKPALRGAGFVPASSERVPACSSHLVTSIVRLHGSSVPIAYQDSPVRLPSLTFPAF